MLAKKRHRPKFLTLTALLTGALGVVRIVRALRRLQEARFYADAGYNISFPLPLDVLLSAAWGVALLVLWWGLWRLHPWAHRAALIMLPAYVGFTLIWLAIFARSDYDTGRLPCVALASVSSVSLFLFIFTRRRIRAAFSLPTNGGLDDRS